MAYQVIARKWRPKSFADLIGQSHVSQTLLNALRNERLPHALLFTGPRGTGKTSSARILAMSLRCPNQSDGIPCGHCEECQEIAGGRSIDVVEVDGASNNGVDAIRELRDTVGYMPSRGKYKIYIIDEVHMLSTSAFNALLKTLEEPPAHVIFILATTEVHKIPQTILSRCQRFDFRRIGTRQIAEHLKNICEREGVHSDERALWAIARQGDGSMRDSQSLLDQVITFSGTDLTLSKVVDVLGLTDRQLLNDTVQALLKRDPQAMVEIINKVLISGYDPVLFARDLLEELRHLLIVKISPADGATIIDVAASEIEFLKDCAANLSEEDIHFLFDMALKGVNDLSRSPDTRIVLEMLLLRMTRAPRLRELSSWMRPENPQGAVASAPAQAPAPKPAPTATSVPVAASVPVATPSKARGFWQESRSREENWAILVHEAQRTQPVLAAKLQLTYLLKKEAENVVLGVSPQARFLLSQLNETAVLQQIQKLLRALWDDQEFKVVVRLAEPGEIAGEHTPKMRAESVEAQRQKELRAKIEEHPVVKEVQAVFKSEVQSIEEIR